MGHINDDQVNKSRFGKNLPKKYIPNNDKLKQIKKSLKPYVDPERDISIVKLKELERLKDFENKRISGGSRYTLEISNLNINKGGSDTSSATSDNTTLLNDLVAYWKLDEISDGSVPVFRLDSGPNGLTLTDNNTTPSAAGLIDNGADFEKTNSEYLELAHNALIAGGPGVSWTVVCWFKPESLTVNDTILAKQGRWHLQVSTGNTPHVRLDASVTLTTAASTPEVMTVGNWFFLVCGYDASVGRAFLQINNGIKYELTHTPGADASGVLYFGRQSAGVYVDGIIDEVGRWARALTASELLTLYNLGSGMTYPFSGIQRTATTYIGPTGGSSRLTNLQTAIDAGYSKIGVFGDSWVEVGLAGLASPLTNGIRTLAQTEYGDAGIGFLKFQATSLVADSRVTSFSKTGTWTDNPNYTGHGPDLGEVTATAAATIDFTATFDRIEIHYRQYTTGGSFQFRVDGGTWQVVNTAGAEAYGKSAITGLSNVSHTVEVDWISGTVVLFGAEMTSGSTGCLVYRIGTGGMQSTHPANNSYWTTALTALDLDCIIILLGTNDITNDVTPATYAANLLAAVAKVPASCDVIVMPSPDEARDITGGKLYNMMAYNQAAYNALYSLGRVAWFSCVDDFGSYGLNQPRAYWQSLHLTSAGYNYLYPLIYNAMLAGR